MDSIIDALSDFSDWIWQKILYFLGYISAFLSSLLSKSFALLTDFYDSTLAKLNLLVSSLYEHIGISDLFSTISILNGSSIGWFLGFMGFDTIFMSVVSAYLIRFAIRRIPFIG